tara:strand:+ start:349 stop:624 length:276 start_codon:yes stop_codon:yes gene_type:complete
VDGQTVKALCHLSIGGSEGGRDRIGGCGAVVWSAGEGGGKSQADCVRVLSVKEELAIVDRDIPIGVHFTRSHQGQDRPIGPDHLHIDPLKR